MVWTGCSTSSHNKYCGNSVIDGVLESSLSVTIDYNLLCIRVCCFFINHAWILIEDTMVIRVKVLGICCQEKIYSGVSRVCCLLYVGR